eukprot:jgi/Psemu1/292870/fgenesh1_pg.1398_\
MIITDGKPRYLMNGTPFSSLENLTKIIEALFQARDSASALMEREEQTIRAVAKQSVTSSLPPEIVRNIAMYFTVKKIDPSMTRALCCSSSANHHELKQCLVDSTSSWWISSYGSFENGVGEEYVEFELSSKTIVRLSALLISIPTMPSGPLSVHSMRLDGLDCERWRPLTPVLQVENIDGWQRIVLETPIDTQFVRVVCLSNQASRLLVGLGSGGLHPATSPGISAVGFYAVQFE